MGTDYDVTPWHYIIAFGSTVLMAYFVYWYINKGHEASDAWNNEHNQLKEALQQEDQELQKNNYEGVTFASTVGDYLVCPSCAFENFKNTRNCTICKTRLITPAPGAAVTAAAPKLQVPASSMV